MMTMQEIKQANAAAGFHFFDHPAMRFFGSRIHATVYPGGFFVTSEQPPHGPRYYTVRRAMPDGSIETVGDFCAYPTRRAAHKAAAAAAA